MDKEEVIKELVDSVISYDTEAVITAVDKAIKNGVPAEEIIEKGLAAGMNEVGALFESGKLFLPNLILATRAMEAGIRILEEQKPSGKKDTTAGVIVTGTVEGDVHDIGKIVVSSMLKISGFEVYDLGRDVPLNDFIHMVKTTNADMLCLSALTTISMSRQKEVIEMLKDEELREGLIVMVGGTPVSQDWADSIGADCYAKNAIEAVEKAKLLLIAK